MEKEEFIKQWKDFIKSSPIDITEEVNIFVTNFLIPDNIDQNKFLANFKILRNGSREIYRLEAELHKEIDLSKYGTKSIDKLASPIDRPIGYPEWFIAAYPDVSIWFTKFADNGDPKTSEILSSPNDEDVINEKGKIKPIYLRKIVDNYILVGEKLECI